MTEVADARVMFRSPHPRIIRGMRGPNRLDARRRRLLTGISQGMTITEAGKHAGYVHRQAAHRAFRSIQLWVPQALEGAGYSVDKVLTELFEKIHSQLEAKETKFFKYRGVVRETREVEAHRIQLRAARELAKMLGLYPRKGDDDTPIHQLHSLTAGPAMTGPSTPDVT